MAGAHIIQHAWWISFCVVPFTRSGCGGGGWARPADDIKRSTWKTYSLLSHCLFSHVAVIAASLILLAKHTMRPNVIAALVAAAAATSGVSAVPFATSKPEQIRSDQDPVFHFYLQAHPKNASQVVLGPVGTSEYFNIGSSIQSTNTSRYLNIGSDSTSYKTLTFDAAASTTAWQLEGDTIITSTSSSYGRRMLSRSFLYL
jgi:hypothetical protein